MGHDLDKIRVNKVLRIKNNSNNNNFEMKKRKKLNEDKTFKETLKEQMDNEKNNKNQKFREKMKMSNDIKKENVSNEKKREHCGIFDRTIWFENYENKGIEGLSIL